MPIPITQMFLVNRLQAGGLERARASLSARLAAIPSGPFTMMGWVVGIYGGTLGTLRSMQSIWRFGGGNLSIILADHSTTAIELRISTDGSAGGQLPFVSTVTKSAIGIREREWHNYIVAFDGTDVRFYINGVQLGAVVPTGATPFTGTVADYWVGNEDDNSTAWNGALGHTAIFDAKKDAAWVAANWNLIQGIDVVGDPDLVAAWIFNGDLTDISGNGQDLSVPSGIGLATLPIVGSPVANQFIPLPPAGTPVDVSTMGGTRTVTVQNAFRGAVQIQFSNEGAAGPWATVLTFSNPGEATIELAGQFMRAIRTGVPIINPGTPVIGIAGTDAGGTYADLPATAGNGTGASIDVSALGSLKTVACLGAFRGTAAIEISVDGGTTWAEVMTFKNPGYQTARFVAEFMRVTRVGVPLVSPGLPNIDVGGIAD
jgi:hypothetical protein